MPVHQHLMAQSNEALRQLVDVVLDAAGVGVKEVAGHEDAMLLLFLLCLHWHD